MCDYLLIGTSRLAPPNPKTLSKEWEEATNVIALEKKMNPISGAYLSLISLSSPTGGSNLRFYAFSRYLVGVQRWQGIRAEQVERGIIFHNKTATYPDPLLIVERTLCPHSIGMSLQRQMNNRPRKLLFIIRRSNCLFVKLKS